MRFRRKRRMTEEEAEKTAKQLAESAKVAEAEAGRDRKLDGYIEIRQTAEKREWGRE